MPTTTAGGGTVFAFPAVSGCGGTCSLSIVSVTPVDTGYTAVAGNVVVSTYFVVSGGNVVVASGKALADIVTNAGEVTLSFVLRATDSSTPETTASTTASVKVFAAYTKPSDASVYHDARPVVATAAYTASLVQQAAAASPALLYVTSGVVPGALSTATVAAAAATDADTAEGATDSWLAAGTVSWVVLEGSGDTWAVSAKLGATTAGQLTVIQNLVPGTFTVRLYAQDGLGFRSADYVQYAFTVVASFSAGGTWYANRPPALKVTDVTAAANTPSIAENSAVNTTAAAPDFKVSDADFHVAASSYAEDCATLSAPALALTVTDFWAPGASAWTPIASLVGGAPTFTGALGAASDGDTLITVTLATGSLDYETAIKFRFNLAFADMCMGSGRVTVTGLTILVDDVNEAPVVNAGAVLTSTPHVPANLNASLFSGLNGTVTDPEGATTFTWTVVAAQFKSTSAGSWTNVAGTALFGISADAVVATSAFAGTALASVADMYKVTVRGTDAGSPAASVDFDVTMEIAEDNVAPTPAAAAFSVTLDENTLAGVTLTPAANAWPSGALATDANTVRGPHTGALVYSIASGSNKFEIADPATGAIRTSAAAVVSGVSYFNFEGAATSGGVEGPKGPFTVVVRACDPGNMCANVTVTVTVANVNEAPVFTSGSTASATVAEIVAGRTSATVVATLAASDPDGTTPTYTLSGAGASDFNISNAGVLTIVTGQLDYETRQSYALTVTVSDGLNTTTGSVAVTVTEVNEPPVWAATAAAGDCPAGVTAANYLACVTVEENSAANTPTSAALAAATDPDTAVSSTGETLTYTVDAASGDSGAGYFYFDAANMTLRVNAAGAAAGVLNFEDASKNKYVVQVAVTDKARGGVTNTVTRKVYVTITNVDEAPVFTSATCSPTSRAENTASGQAVVTAAATDPEAAAVTYTLTGVTAVRNTARYASGTLPDVSGLLTVSASGAVTTAAVVPDYDKVTGVTFTVVATDATSHASQVSCAFAITDVDEPPYFYSGSNTDVAVTAFSANVVTDVVTDALVLLLQGFDPDRDVVTISEDTSAGKTDAATAALFDVKLVSGAYYVTSKTTRDGSGAAPYLTLGTVYTVYVTASSTYPSGTAKTAAATVTLTVVASSVAPTVTSTTFTIAEVVDAAAAVTSCTSGCAVVGTVPLTHVNPITVSISAGNTGFAFAISTAGVLSIANPSAVNFETTPQFQLTVQVADASQTATATVTVTVINVNDAPVWTAGALAGCPSGATNAKRCFNINENVAGGTEAFVGSGSTTGTFPLATDEDTAQNLTYAADAASPFEVFDTGSGNSLRLKAGAAINYETMGANKYYLVPVTVSDHGSPSPKSVTGNLYVVVNDVNEAPVVNAGAVLTSTPHVPANLNASLFSGLNGTVTDPEGATTFTWTVVAAQFKSTSAGSWTNVAGTALFGISADAVVATSAFAGTALASVADMYKVTVRGTDAGSPAASVDFDVTMEIAEDNVAPTPAAAAFSVTLDENTLAGVTLTPAANAWPSGALATDANTVRGPHTGALVYSIASGSNKFEIADPATGAIRTSAAAVVSGVSYFNFEGAATSGGVEGPKGPFTVVVRACDPGNMCANVTVTVTVANVNEAPVFTSGSTASATVAEIVAGRTSATVVATLAASDPDGTTPTYTLSGAGASDFNISNAGVLTIVTGQLDYETRQSYALTVTVSDGLNTTTGSVAVTVTEVNEPPVWAATAAAGDCPAGVTAANYLACVTVEENSAANTPTSAALAAATDPDTAVSSTGETLTYTVDAASGDSGAGYFYFDAANMTLRVNAAGAAAGVLNFEDASKNKYVVQVAVTDKARGGVTNTVTRKVYVTITNVDEAPVFTSATCSPTSRAENTASGQAVVTAAATDPEAAAVTYTLTGVTAVRNTARYASGTLPDVSGLLTVSASGAVTTAAVVPDYDKVTGVTFTVVATDATSHASQVSCAFAITDVDEPPYFYSGSNTDVAVTAFSANVVTDVVTDALVLLLQGFDPDRDVVTISEDTSAGKTDAATAALFDVKLVSGAYYVTSKTTRDGSGAAPYLTLGTVYTVYVTASSTYPSGTAKTAAATVTLTVVASSVAPTVTSTTFTIAEVVDAAAAVTSCTSGCAVVGTVPLTHVNPITVSISAGNTGFAFAISTAGVLSIANPSAVNFETTPQFQLTVQVADASQTATATVTVTVINVNDAPVWTAGALAGCPSGATNAKRCFNINENVAGGTEAFVGSGSTTGTFPLATDEDTAQNLTYAADAASPFEVFDTGSGNSLRLKAGAAINYETMGANKYYLVPVTVSDHGSPSPKSVTGNLYVVVNDVNDPPTLAASSTRSVREDAAPGALGLTLSASDADASHAFTYTATRAAQVCWYAKVVDGAGVSVNMYVPISLDSTLGGAGAPQTVTARVRGLSGSGDDARIVLATSTAAGALRYRVTMTAAATTVKRCTSTDEGSCTLLSATGAGTVLTGAGPNGWSEVYVQLAGSSVVVGTRASNAPGAPLSAVVTATDAATPLVPTSLYVSSTQVGVEFGSLCFANAAASASAKFSVDGAGAVSQTAALNFETQSAYGFEVQVADYYASVGTTTYE